MGLTRSLSPAQVGEEASVFDGMLYAEHRVLVMATRLEKGLQLSVVPEKTPATPAVMTLPVHLPVAPELLTMLDYDAAQVSPSYCARQGQRS